MTKPDFWWFEGESVRTIAKQLLKIGTNNARLKVVPSGDSVLLQVVEIIPSPAVAGVRDNAFAPVNEAHPCPPDC